MNVGFVGLGKLGLPVAYAIAAHGHAVYGTDVNLEVRQYLDGHKKPPYQEEQLAGYMDKAHVCWRTDATDVVHSSDVVFVAVQTPHEPEYEGTTRLTDERADFNYEYLETAVRQVREAADGLGKKVTLVTISTCLPGTFEERIKPLLSENVDYVYNPFFIAMGTVIHDFLHPEFVLVGRDDSVDSNGVGYEKLGNLYFNLNLGPMFVTDIRTAEGIKVFYNTFITAKTVLANTYGEMAHRLDMNVDDIYKALSMAGDRIISPKYLKAGMGDGGGCHPRDNIALSFLAEKLNMSHNIFDDLMKAREDHAEWLADLCLSYGKRVLILGKAFKSETNIETGSPAVLVANILKEKGAEVRHVEDDLYEVNVARIILIGTQHERYKNLKFYRGTVVIDPFGYIPDQEGVNVVRVGR